MATVQLLTSQTFDNSAITGNGSFDLWISPTVSNSNLRSSIKLIVDYEDNQPVPGSIPDPVQYDLVAFLESDDGSGGGWYPFHYQFEPYRVPNSGRQHILIMEPGIFNLDEGVPIDIWDGVRVVARQSKKQGSVPDNFRVRIQLNEFRYGEPGAFQSATISVHYQLYG